MEMGWTQSLDRLGAYLAEPLVESERLKNTYGE
jgi:hypothetical protein